MTLYEWGKGSPAQQERRVSDIEKRLSEQEAAVEAAYREAKAELEIRRREVVEMRAQLDRYHHAISTKKVQAAFGIEERQRQLPTRLDFISKSIRAEIALAGVLWAAFEDGVARELTAVISEMAPEAAVDAVLARAGLGDDLLVVSREAVVADLEFCEKAMASAQEQGGYAVIRALTQIEKHFEIFDTSDPVYGLPEARWREIVAAWAVEFNIPDTVIIRLRRVVFVERRPGWLCRFRAFPTSILMRRRGLPFRRLVFWGGGFARRLFLMCVARSMDRSIRRTVS